MTEAVAAIDLGATSGRVMLGFVGHDELSIRPVARFPNNPVRTIDGLHWGILELYRNVLAGVAAAAREEPGLRSLGVDSWAVDYALMRGNRMLGTPYHYRDDRNTAAVERVHAGVDARTLYHANGLQHLPFNTMFQLDADRHDGGLEGAESMLLIPDLINYWLTGERYAERSNASTTGLLDPRTREWDLGLADRVGVPRHILPPLIDAGQAVGPLLPAVARELGISHQLTVNTVGSHDTASAVVAVPASGEDFAYISCGTWGLVGVETERPIITEAGLKANFTNEGGVDGRTRYLHNVMGLWLLSESVRHWERDGRTIELPALLAQAAAVEKPMPTFDANDPRFMAPGPMPERIADYFTEHGIEAPSSRPEMVRSIIESLAEAFADTVRTAGELSGKAVSVVHIVGGGSQNTLLCQLTADRTGLPVLAGPVEATAIGNVLIQARTQGLVTGSLESLRALVARAFSPITYTPRASAASV